MDPVIVFVKYFISVGGLKFGVKNGSLVNVYFNFVTNRFRLFRREGRILGSATLVSISRLSLPFFHEIKKNEKKRVVKKLNIQAVDLQ